MVWLHGSVRIGLLVVLLIGLAATAPVSCVCVPSDHGDMSVHPIFPHTHPSDIGHADQAHHHPSQQPVSGTQDGEPLPSLQTEVGSGAIGPVAAGASILMLLRPWMLHVGVVGTASTPPVRLPRSIAQPPLPPPPRSSSRLRSHETSHV
ncbi:MAG: hypothetical protein U0893_03760 [Chloroflexota bacterium]